MKCRQASAAGLDVDKHQLLDLTLDSDFDHVVAKPEHTRIARRADTLSLVSKSYHTILTCSKKSIRVMLNLSF